jgi:RHS repeat-associated protein
VAAATGYDEPMARTKVAISRVDARRIAPGPRRCRREPHLALPPRARKVAEIDTVQELDAYGERKLRRPGPITCVDGIEATIGTNNVSRPLSACAPTATVLGRFGIGGARQHGRTKLVDLRNRVYATHLRMFLSQDPLGNVDAEGLYAYVAGDPVNFRDPWGLEKTRGAGVEGGPLASKQSDCNGGRGDLAACEWIDQKSDECFSGNNAACDELEADSPAQSTTSTAERTCRGSGCDVRQEPLERWRRAVIAAVVQDKDNEKKDEIQDSMEKQVQMQKRDRERPKKKSTFRIVACIYLSTAIS